MSAATVNTTAGPLEADRLGFVLPHEHVLIASPDVRLVWPESFDRTAARRRCVERLSAARAAGVDTLVDVTTIDFGRDAQFVQEVATALTPHEDKIFRAAARAHRTTGVPITTHTDAAQKCGLDQQRVLAEEGTDLSRVIIGHSETADYAYLERLLDRGSYLGIDRFGADNVADPAAAAQRGRPTHAQRLAIVARLCRDGYAAQLLLSHDTAGLSVFPVDWYDQTYPNARFDYLPGTVIPELLEAGVSQHQIDQMTRDNPRALFARQEPY